MPDDWNGVSDVFVVDLRAGTTTRVSVSQNGTGGDAASSFVSISGNGRRIAVATAATNLSLPAPPAGTTRLYVRDLNNEETTPVATNADGTFEDGVASTGVVAPDGRSAICRRSR